MLDKIITHEKGKKFIRFANADGKRWVVPLENMQVALNLYQPSGVRGKVLKNLLPLLHSLAPVRKAIKAESLNCALQEELQAVLQKIFGTGDIEFSIFEGTPSVHQKITIQLSRGRKILGYCKASDKGDILSLFEQETKTLCTLARRGIKDIPEALFCGTLSNGVHIFVQSTKKSNRSRTPHKWGCLHEGFLYTLHEKTKQRILFEHSDYHHTLQTLQKHLGWLPAEDEKSTVAAAIEKILKKYSNKEVEYSAFHGDFTPWNMFVEEGRLFVFDFEYAALTYPAGLDRYHFELQTAIFEKRLSAEEIAAYMQRCAWVEREKFTMYLLSMLSQYTLREKGVVGGDVAHSFGLWFYLLKAFD